MRTALFALTTLLLTITCGCGSTSPAGLKVPNAFRPLLWPETKLVGGVDLRSLKSTDLYSRHRQEISQALSRMGGQNLPLDAEQDLDGIHLASNGSDTVVFATGRFDHDRILNEAKKKGAHERRFSSYSAVENGSDSLVFLTDTALLAGTTRSVESALKVQDSGKGELPEQLTSRLYSLSAASQIYFVTSAPLSMSRVPMRADMQTNLSNFADLISGMTVGLEVGSGVKLRSTADCISTDASTRVNDALRGFLGLARLSTKDNETDMLRVYDAIQITKDATAVRVNADLSGPDVDRLWTRFNQVRGGH